jgi:Domain of unknown function (DUF4124)
MTPKAFPTTCRPGHLCLAHLVLAAGWMLAAGPASAVLYKWVDASGRVSYSDQPPLGNVKVEVVNGAPPPDAEAVREMANTEADLKKRLAQRTEDKKKAEKARSEADAQQQACFEARGRLQIFSSGQLITFINEQGEQLIMDDVRMARERERATTEVRRNCNG